jgi:hypothetical protein
MDIAIWLRGLGLEQYATAFRDNAVDGEVLRELTADDLKDLGRRHRNSYLLFTSWRRATIDTEAPGACVSATI